MIINAPFQQLEAKEQPNNSGENNRQLQFSLFFWSFYKYVLPVFWLFFEKEEKKKHRAVFSLRLLFADTFFQMILLHLQTFPFLSSFLKKHRKAGKSFPGTTDHGNAQVGAMQPKAERPHVHGGTSPLKDKFIMYLRGKTTNPSLLTDLNRQKLRHNSLGSMTPPHPLLFPGDFVTWAAGAPR